MDYGEFEQEFRKHHTCGIPFIPYDLAYSSDCPKCEPELGQWKEKCKRYYEQSRIFYDGLTYRKVPAERR